MNYISSRSTFHDNFIRASLLNEIPPARLLKHHSLYDPGFIPQVIRFLAIQSRSLSLTLVGQAVMKYHLSHFRLAAGEGD
jgi:hypothetical protein